MVDSAIYTGKEEGSTIKFSGEEEREGIVYDSLVGPEGVVLFAILNIWKKTFK